MKAWHCSYYQSFGYGAYQEYDCIVVAEIQSKALGMALMNYPDTIAEHWSATEIPIDKEGVHEISSRCN